MFMYWLAVPGQDDRYIPAVMDLYDRTFPPDVKVPISEAERSWTSGKRRIWLAAGDSGFVGFAITMPLPSGGGELLEYLAIEPPYRSMGVGSGLLSRIKGSLLDLGVTRLLVECRHPSLCTDGRDRSMAIRRMAFYSRNGASTIPSYPVHYCPNFVAGKVTRRIIMQFPLAGTAQPTEDEVVRLILDIYMLSYMGVDSYLSPSTTRG